MGDIRNSTYDYLAIPREADGTFGAPRLATGVSADGIVQSLRPGFFDEDGSVLLVDLDDVKEYELRAETTTVVVEVT